MKKLLITFLSTALIVSTAYTNWGGNPAKQIKNAMNNVAAHVDAAAETIAINNEAKNYSGNIVSNAVINRGPGYEAESYCPGFCNNRNAVYVNSQDAGQTKLPGSQYGRIVPQYKCVCTPNAYYTQLKQNHKNNK